MSSAHTSTPDSEDTLALPIFLVGFMGCGKSTIGEELARLLHRPFIDLDARIEALTNRSISDIFTHDGEQRFRQIESKALREAAQMGTAVIALGGGAVTQAENRELMNQTGITIWLNAPFELCWQRIQKDGNIRPLAPDETTARLRYQERQMLYAEADVIVEIPADTPPVETAEEILELLAEEE
jgi:shikimate kinase